MKNLPEKEFWSSIRNRLENYSEVPDDDSWDKIAGALPRTGSSWPKRTVGILLIFMTGTLAGYLLHDGMDVGSMVRESTGSISHALQGSDVVSNGSDRTSSDTTMPEMNNVAAGETLAPKDSQLPMRTTSDEDSRQEKTAGRNPGSTTTPSNRSAAGTIMKKPSLERSIVTLPSPAVVSGTSNETKSVESNEGESSTLSLDEVSETMTNKTRSNNVNALVNDNAQDVREMEKVTGDSSVNPNAGKKKEESEKKKRIFHADVYATLTPSLSFQKISPSGTDDIRVIGLASEGVMSSQRLGITFEAGFQRRLSKKFEWYGGFSFYHQRQQLTYEYNSTEVSVKYSDNGGYTLTPVTVAKTFDYNMTNVGITSGVFYHLSGEKLMHKVGGGLQFQKGLLTKSGEGSYGNSQSTYLNYQLSYRLECSLSRSVNVYLQPTFIHAIIAKEALTEPFDIKPYKAGIGIGAIYHF